MAEGNAVNAAREAIFHRAHEDGQDAVVVLAEDVRAAQGIPARIVAAQVAVAQKV